MMTPERRARRRLLAEVTAALEASVLLPHLDADDRPISGDRLAIPQARWFRFRRPLRFGVGSADSDQSVRALVFVDDTAVDEDGVTPGLLLTGAPHHLCDPYRFDAPDDAAGARSGSGSGELFRWLREAQRTVDADELAGLGGAAAELFLTSPGRAETAVAMYRLFAQDDWLTPHFPDIGRPAGCEGIAIATLVVAGDITVLMGSPLYVRVASPADEHGTDPARESRPSLLSRLFGR